jgi:hypothetical protein
MAEKKSGSILGKVLAWGLLLALLALVAFQLRNSMQGVLTRGEQAPDFTLTTFDGQTISAAQMAG